MATVKYKLSDLFKRGNAKMGDSVLTWSIPAIRTCPGRSKLCEGLCYADKNFFKWDNVKSSMQKNWKLSQQDDFVDIASGLLKKVKDDTLLRIHVAGDFYDATYADKWLQILKQNPHLQAWAYSRSYRIPTIRPILEDIADLSHVRIWYSVDKETGIPNKLHPKIRLAYLSTDDSDQPPPATDLVFRDYAARGSVMKYVNGALVCPAENGISGHVHCDQCKICILDPLEHPNKRTHNRVIANQTPLPTTLGRISLATV